MKKRNLTGWIARNKENFTLIIKFGTIFVDRKTKL